MSVALEPESILDSLRPKRAAVYRRLADVRRQIRTGLALAGVVRTWAAIFLFLAASLAADWLLRLGLPVRLSFLVLAAAAIGVIAFRSLIRPLALELADLDVAALLDQRHPGVGQKL